jgi:hypothetical protein
MSQNLAVNDCMTHASKTFLKKYSNGIIFIACCVLAYALAVTIVNKKLEDYRSRVEVQISDQRALLNTIAEVTARNGADQVTEAIVHDCSIDERNDFDSLLSRLNGTLTPVELARLNRLFDRCGLFYAERKSVMVARLVREIDVYSSYVDQLKTISSKKNVDSYSVETWKKLATAEQKQSRAFTKLATDQGNIIQALSSGKSSNSEEVKAILKEVHDTQQELANAYSEAIDIRTELIKL